MIMFKSGFAAIRGATALWAIAITAAFGLFALPANAEKRVALVIGNAAYQAAPALANPTNDATATATILQEAGFDVLRTTDASLTALRRDIEAFVKKVEQSGPGATALVFYAGHGAQLDGTNYLLPVDVRPSKDLDIPGQAVSLGDILKRLDATPAAIKIVVLDACRDNPFASIAVSMARGLALVGTVAAEPRNESGLTRVESKGGTLVAFSTSPGATAADGAGRHSPFTAALLEAMREPGLPVEQVFKRVRLAVHEATQGVQTPWETSSLTANFSFMAGGANGGSPDVTGAIPERRPSRAALQSRSAAEAYEIAIYWDDPEVYRLFVELYPEDSRALRIHRILSLRQEEMAWAETVRLGDAESFRLFMRLYPDSAHAAEARRLAATAPQRGGAQTASVCLPTAPTKRVIEPRELRKVKVEPPPAPVTAPRVQKARAEPPPPPAPRVQEPPVRKAKAEPPAKPVRAKPAVVEEEEDEAPPVRVVRPKRPPPVIVRVHEPPPVRRVRPPPRHVDEVVTGSIPHRQPPPQPQGIDPQAASIAIGILGGVIGSAILRGGSRRSHVSRPPMGHSPMGHSPMGHRF